MTLIAPFVLSLAIFGSRSLPRLCDGRRGAGDPPLPSPPRPPLTIVSRSSETLRGARADPSRPPAAPAPFGLALPHIAPYPDGKGDEDGLSEDPNDCNKGCIDGNTPD